jgi:hypothetical protein
VPLLEKETIVQWFETATLYETLPNQTSWEDTVESILLFDSTFDMFCPECAGTATFVGEVVAGLKNQVTMSIQTGQRHQLLRKPRFAKRIVCTRADHPVDYYFARVPAGVQKVGQIPSLADIALSDTVQFRKVLDAQHLRELNKAIGLAAHGVGIGAYIYLRRIFEALVEEAHQAAAARADWDEAAYVSMRMRERVQALKEDLPRFLVENPGLYGVLSKHVHELSDEECLANFEPLKTAVLIIAEDRLMALQQKRMRDAASAAVTKLNEKYNGTATPAK